MGFGIVGGLRLGHVTSFHVTSLISEIFYPNVKPSDSSILLIALFAWFEVSDKISLKPKHERLFE